MRLISKLQKYGLRGVFRIILKKVFLIEIMKFHYLKTIINIDVLQQKLKDFDLDVKELEYNDFLLGDNTVFHGKKMEVMKQRFNDLTYKGYGIIEKGVLVYSTWISLEKMGLPFKSNYMLKKTEGYFEDSHCHIVARGRKLHSKMNYYCLAKLYEFGKKEAICIVIDKNFPAIKTQINSEAKDLGSFYAGEFFGIPFVALNKSKYDSQ
jgi:hypothetical protein